MFYPKCEKVHDHITNSSETDEKDAWKDNVALSNALTDGKHEPKPLKKEG